MVSQVRTEPLAIRGIPLIWPRVAAFQGGSLALVDGRDQLLVFSDVGTASMRVTFAERLDWKPGWVRLSPSERFLLLGSSKGNYVQVFDLQDKKVLIELAGPETMVAAIGLLGDDEVLVHSRRPGRLDAVVLPSLRAVLGVDVARPRPLVWTSFASMGDGDRWAFVGHRFLERDDQLVIASLEELSSLGPAEAAEVLGGKPVMSAVELVARPVGTDQVAVLTATALVLRPLDADTHIEQLVTPKLAQLQDLSATSTLVLSAYPDRLVVSPLDGGEATELPCLTSALAGHRAVVVDRKRNVALVTAS